MSDLCYHCDDCDFRNGLCHCGCGKNTLPLASTTIKQRKLPSGAAAKFIKGHANYRSFEKRQILMHKRQAFELFDDCPWCDFECGLSGQCHCGCGKQAVRSNCDRFSEGVLKGMPYKTLRGHHARKLTDDDVAKMRYLFATTEITQDELAKMFKVAQVTVSRVMHYDVHKEAGFKRP